MKIKLKFPFTAPSGQHIEELDTRRLKVKDIKNISRQAGGDEAQMETLGVALMAGMIPENRETVMAPDQWRERGAAGSSRDRRQNGFCSL